MPERKLPSEQRRLERRAAERSKNKLLFGLPLAPYFSAEQFDFFMAAFNNRHYVKAVGQYIALAHNTMIHTARAANAEHDGKLWDYLVFVEHDHRFDFTEVWAAIEEYDPEQHPVVAHLYPTRSYPVFPVGYNYDPQSKAYTALSEEQMRLWKVEQPGLHRADGVPMGLTAIHKSVFDRLEEHKPDEPFFASPVGKTGTEGMSDDIYFSHRCREAEIPIFFDTRFDISHVGEMPFGFQHYFAQMDVIHAAEAAKRPQIEIPRLEIVGGKP